MTLLTRKTMRLVKVRNGMWGTTRHQTPMARPLSHYKLARGYGLAHGPRGLLSALSPWC